jgi:hypothetical protein
MLGLLLHAIVHPADIEGRAGGILVLILSHRRCGELCEVGLGVLCDRPLQPQTCLHRVRLARRAAGEITAEHQLRMTVTQFGGGAEPALCDRAIDWKYLCPVIHRAERRAAMALAAAFSNSLIALADVVANRAAEFGRIMRMATTGHRL